RPRRRQGRGPDAGGAGAWTPLQGRSRLGWHTRASTRHTGGADHPGNRGTMTTPSGAGLAPSTATIEHGDLQRSAELLGRVNAIFGQRVIGQEALRTALVSTLL